MSDRHAPPKCRYDPERVQWQPPEKGPLICSHCYEPFGRWPEKRGTINIWPGGFRYPRLVAFLCDECVYAISWEDHRGELERDASELEALPDLPDRGGRN